MTDRQRGFTLVEIMVALIIFGIVSVTLLVRLGDTVRSEQYLETKTVATLVAQNTLADLRMKKDWNDVRAGSELVDMAGQKWRVKVIVQETANEDLRRVDVKVGPDTGRSRDGNYVITLSTFIGKH